MTSIAAAVIGLAPMLQVIADVGTFVMPVFVRMTKFPAVLRLTAAGPEARDVPVVKLSTQYRPPVDWREPHDQ